MKKEKNFPLDKGLSQRSDEVNEVMGAIPSWIARWGMALMVIILMGLGIGAYTLTIPEYLEVPYFIKGTSPFIAQICPTNGTLIAIAKEHEHCHSHDSIATLETQNIRFPVAANANGIFYQNLIHPIGTYVFAGDTIGWVKSSKRVKQTLLLQIPNIKSNKVKVGQTVHIMQLDNQTFIIGRIHRISAVSIGTNIIAEVVLNDTTPNSFYPDYGCNGQAKIIINQERLINMINCFYLKN